LLRKTMVVLAIALALGSSALSTTALARGRGGGFGGGGFGGGHFSNYGRVSGLRGGFHDENGRRDVWSHWGAYYGPMIGDPF
jgi:uncharacterized membrane protein